MGLSRGRDCSILGPLLQTRQWGRASPAVYIVLEVFVHQSSCGLVVTAVPYSHVTKTMNDLCKAQFITWILTLRISNNLRYSNPANGLHYLCYLPYYAGQSTCQIASIITACSELENPMSIIWCDL